MATIKTYIVRMTTSTTAQSLPENVAMIQNCLLITNAVPGANLAPVTGSPGSTQVQFTGTVSAPASALTLNAAVATDSLLIINAVPAAGNIAGA